MRARRTAQRPTLRVGAPRAGEAGAGGAGSGDTPGEVASPSGTGASGTRSGRPNATTWGRSLAFGARTPW